MSFGIAMLLGLLWFAYRTHKRRHRITFQHGSMNAAVWRFANRRRFRLGPKSWRLNNSEDTF